MISLNSSCIASVDYDPDTRQMPIRFRNGRTFTLRGVPEYHFTGLINSSSPGWYFNTYLKGRY